jgi:GGDEF domain-containing protein
MTPSLGGTGGRAGASAEGFDPETGFVLAPRFAMRIRDCLASGSGPVVIGSCQLVNLAEIARANAPHALRVLLSVGDSLRAQLPFSHTLARTAASELCFLLPNAGDDPEARAKDLVTRVARQIARDASANFPIPIEMAFGYAQGPRDGADASVLLRAARRPRLRLARPR